MDQDRCKQSYIYYDDCEYCQQFEVVVVNDLYDLLCYYLVFF